MRKLSLLDLGFFIAETEASPKHVAGLLILKLPKGASASFARQLAKDFASHTEVKPPFNRVIQFPMSAMPQWADADAVDVSQHVHYHKLPAKQNDRQALFDYVAALHVPMLDRSRPLWELHIIDGVAGGRVALYQKIHHAYADGVTMTRWTAQGLTERASDLEVRPIWTLEHAAYARQRAQRGTAMLQSVWQELGSGGKRALGVARLGAMLLLEAAKLTKNAIALPFVAARTPLTGQVGSGRQFAATSVPMARIDAIRKRTRSTVNHVALTCIDGALRRYLADLGVKLKRPITIQMPVNLRREGDTSAGNKIGIIGVELSGPTEDPVMRLQNIGHSLRNVRTMVDSVAPEAIETYSLVTGLTAQLAEMLRLSDKLPPLGNTLVSNVPGPKKPLYLKGALMEEMHPVSTLPPSNLLNITLFSYAGNLNFGLIATDELPALPKLAEYVRQAFGELEESVNGAGAT